MGGRLTAVAVEVPLVLSRFVVHALTSQPPVHSRVLIVVQFGRVERQLNLNGWSLLALGAILDEEAAQGRRYALNCNVSVPETGEFVGTYRQQQGCCYISGTSSNNAIAAIVGCFPIQSNDTHSPSCRIGLCSRSAIVFRHAPRP